MNAYQTTESVPCLELGDMCLEHLQHEQSVMQAVIGQLESIRARLLQQRLAELTDMWDQPAVPGEVLKLLRESRQRIRECGATVLGIPVAEVRLSTIAQHLPAERRSQLDVSQEKTRQLLRQLHLVGRANVMLLGQSMQLLRELVTRLTGIPAEPETYGASGHRNLAEPLPFMQAQI